MKLFSSLVPKWKHSDTTIRLNAVKQLKNENILVKIARSDNIPEIRKTALTNIKNLSLFLEVTQPYSEWYRYAMQHNKLSQEELKTQILDFLFNDTFYNKIKTKYKDISGKLSRIESDECVRRAYRNGWQQVSINNPDEKEEIILDRNVMEVWITQTKPERGDFPFERGFDGKHLE
jgi:hypothetical protein